MTDVTVLPSQEPPKQLTARAVIKHLGEHLQAFLAHNNMHGVLTDPDYVLRDDRVADILLRIACTDQINLKELKLSAVRLRDLTHKTIKLSEGFNLVARAMGYRYWTECKMCATPDDMVINVWSSDSFGHEIMFEGKPLTKVEARAVFSNPLVAEMKRQHYESKNPHRRK